MSFINIKIKVLISYAVIVLIVLATLAVSIVYVFGEGSYDSVEELEHILFISIPVIVLFFVFFAWFIVNNILKRVQLIINEANEIQADDLTKRLTSSNGSDELEELIITFNNMLDRLDESFSKTKRFSNDVSHELKTPLTVLRGELELGLRKNRSIQEYKNILNNGLEETKQLQELIDSLLFLSNNNQEDLKSIFVSVDLDEVVIDAIGELTELLKDKNISIEFGAFENIVTNGHIHLLKILIGNIIQNSIKYSHKNSKINISLINNELIIKDFGIGIKNKDIKNIFDRFYRVDEVRGRSGYGLGLSIVNQIAILHNYKIDVKSKYGEFTQFTVIVS
jgi:signal transduction histidine kinase